MKLILLIIGTIARCKSCNFTFEEEDKVINDKGIRFNEVFGLDSFHVKYQYSLVPESSVVSISQEGILHFKRGTDRDWLCKVSDMSLNCNCKEILCRISVGIWMQEMPTTKQQPPKRKLFEVCIKDKNDNCPKLPNIIHKTLIESTKVGSILEIPLATDLDSLAFSNAIYNMKCNKDSSKFKLNTESNSLLQLELISPLDYETLTSHSCKLKACEDGCCSTSSLTITVTDDNDFSPTWTVTSWLVSLPENSPPNTQVMQLSATDSDATYNQLTYTIDGSRQDLFLVESRTGIIQLAGYLDYETMIDKTILLNVKVTDNGLYQPRSATGTVTISVSDVNDNRPVIHLKNSIVILEENISQAYLGSITATDPDSGINGVVTCFVSHPEDKVVIKSPNEPSKSTIYDIYSTESFDREMTPRVLVKIVCSDMGQHKLSSEVTLILQIKDVDDNNVKFTKKIFAAGIDEEREIGCFITQVEAVDKDSSSFLEYYLSNKHDAQLVEIDKNTGVLRTNQVFDREVKSEYEIIVRVREKQSPNKTDSATVLIKILDINDNDPKFEQPYSLSVSENQEINFEIGKVVAHDPDLRNNGTVVFSQYHPNDKVYNHFPLFFVDQIGKIRLFHKLDYETQSIHHLIVTASDLGYPISRTTTSTVIVSVIDENDNAPRFKLKFFEIDIGCHTRYLSSDLFPVTDNDTDPKNRQMTYQFSIIAPITVEKYFGMDNQTGEITISIDQPGGIACSMIPKSIKLKLTVSDPNVPDFKDYCIVHLRSQPLSTTVSENHLMDQKTHSQKRKTDQKQSDTELSTHNQNQFDSNLVLIIILTFFSLILLFLLCCVVIFTKRCRENEQERISKGERDPSDYLRRRSDKTIISSQIKIEEGDQNPKFPGFPQKATDDGMTTNSSFSESLIKKLDDRFSNADDDRNEYQLLNQSQDYRNLSPQQKYFTSYMLPNTGSLANHSLILSTDVGNKLLSVKPTVSTSFV